MRAGRLNQRITLQTNTPTVNSFGERIEVWADTATVWAHINPQSAREFLAQGIQAQQVSHMIDIRYRGSVTPEMRVKFVDRNASTRYFDIEQVLEPATAGERLALICKEII